MNRRHDQWPQRWREVVAHVGDHQQVRTGNRLGRGRPAAGSDQRVVASVDDERRNVEASQRLGPVTAGVDGGELAGPTLGIEAAVERLTGALADAVDIDVTLRRPDRTARRRVDVCGTLGWWDREQNVERLRLGLADSRIA